MKRPSVTSISDQLNAGYPRSATTMDLSRPGEPITITQMVLNLTQLKPYDRNPRRSRNPLYEEIKESIRQQRGLNNPLTVTRRPGDPDPRYMVESGGNTRLSILSELYAETRDEAFNTLNVLYRPWSRESLVLGQHLIENSLRSDISLLEKALAILDLKALIEAEEGEALSDRAYEKRLKEIGYRASARQLARFAYVARLNEICPQTTAALGARVADDIKMLESAHQSVWNAQGRSDTEFDATFSLVLAQTDSPHFELRDLIEALEVASAERLGLSPGRVRLEAEAASLENRRGSTTDVDERSENERDLAPIVTEMASNVTNFSVTEERPSAEPVAAPLEPAPEAEPVARTSAPAPKTKGAPAATAAPAVDPHVDHDPIITGAIAHAERPKVLFTEAAEDREKLEALENGAYWLSVLDQLATAFAAEDYAGLDRVIRTLTGAPIGFLQLAMTWIAVGIAEAADLAPCMTESTGGPLLMGVLTPNGEMPDLGLETPAQRLQNWSWWWLLAHAGMLTGQVPAATLRHPTSPAHLWKLVQEDTEREWAAHHDFQMHLSGPALANLAYEFAEFDDGVYEKFMALSRLYRAFTRRGGEA